jgi:hypothetical protein
MKSSAGPHNPMSFYDSLKLRADLQGGNPSTGQLSLSTNAPLQISQPSQGGKSRKYKKRKLKSKSKRRYKK